MEKKSKTNVLFVDNDENQDLFVVVDNMQSKPMNDFSEISSIVLFYCVQWRFTPK